MTKKIPQKILNTLEPLLNTGEKITCVFREPYRWLTLQSRWLVLTDLRLIIVYKTFIGVVSSDEIHLRDLDIELIRTKIGLFDLIIFRTRDRQIYQTGASRFRRKEVAEFIKNVTLGITKREIAFRANIAQNSTENVQNQQSGISRERRVNQKRTTCDNIKSISELNKLRQAGGISDKEYLLKKDELMKKI